MDTFSFVLYCKFNLERVPITLYKDTCYADLVRLVCDRFKISTSGVSLRYSVRGDESIYLRSNEELNDMRSLFSVLEQRLVDVTVVDGSVIAWTGEVSGGTSVLTCDDSGEGCVAESSKTVMRVYKTDAWASCLTGVGQVFDGGASEFRCALRKYCVQAGREYAFEKNRVKKVYAFCKERASTGCSWFVKASYRSRDGKFATREFNPEHVCEKKCPIDANKQLNSLLVADIFKQTVRDNPSLCPSSVLSELRREYELHVSYFKAWEGVQKAKILNGWDVSDSYNELERYIAALQETNPSSPVSLEVYEDVAQAKKFKRLFFSYGGCIEGFKHIRPLLFIDGTFLKGKFKGTLLSAVGKNGNKGLYPLAFALVDGESTLNWEWFLMQVRVTIGSDRPLTFLSDRHKGLLEGMARVFPDSIHCYCLQHLKDNLKTRFSGGDVCRNDLVRLLGECATAPTVALLEQNLAKLNKLGGKRMEDFLGSIELEKWTEAYCSVCRYGETTSNAVESFNGWILDVRNMAVTEMIDTLRIKLMRWFDERRTKSEKWTGILCEFYEEKWNKSLHNSLGWEVLRSSAFIFEVMSQPSHSVDLEKRKCSYHKWQFEGFPCGHAVLCIVREKLPIKNFVEECFWAETYRRSYSVPINPVPSCLWRDSELINNSRILPPDLKSKRGRLQKKRFPTRGEIVSAKKVALRCGNCKQLGHNRRKCDKLGSMEKEKVATRCGKCKQFGYNKRTCVEQSSSA